MVQLFTGFLYFRYFAAFPSLNEKIEKETDIFQHNIKNAWCGVCTIKKLPKLHTSNKCNQPIIPYSPLKQIKAIYQNVESTALLHHDKKISSLAHLKVNEKNCIDPAFDNRVINCAGKIELTKQVLSSVKGSWKEIYSFITKPIPLFLEHLCFIQINVYFLHKEFPFNSNYGLTISIEKPNSFIKTILEANFVILNFDKSSNLSEAKNVFSNLISFQKDISNKVCADFTDLAMSGHINDSISSNINNGQSSSHCFGEQCVPNISNMYVACVQNTPNLFMQPTNLEPLSFEGNFETEKKFELNLLPSDSLVANQMLYPVNVVRDYHSGLYCFTPGTYTFPTIKMDSNALYDENLSIEENYGLHLKEYVNAQQFCVKDNVLNCNQSQGHQLLNKDLFINDMYIAPPNKAPSTSFEDIASLIPFSNETMSNELESQAFVSSKENIENVQDCKDTVQTSSPADWPHKSTKVYNEMWVLYWGDNHNFISNTWHKDFTPLKSMQKIELPNYSEYFIALSKEIRRDGDELLKLLYCISSIGDDPVLYDSEVPISVQNDFHSDSNYNSQTSGDEDPLILQHFADLNDTNMVSPVIDTSFTNISIGSVSPQILHTQVYQNSHLNFENNYINAPDSPDLNALPFNSQESVDSIESNYYVEGGGWSVEDSFINYSSVNPNERAGSLDGLVSNTSIVSLLSILYLSF